MLKYNNNLTLSKGGLDIGLKVGILAEIGYMLQECALAIFCFETLTKVHMVEPNEVHRVHRKRNIASDFLSLRATFLNESRTSNINDIKLLYSFFQTFS